MKTFAGKAVLTGFVTLLSLAFSASFALAQTSQGLEIKPAIIEDNVNPGDTYHFALTVKNVSDTGRTFTLSAQDILGLDANGQPIFAQNNEPTGYELSSWVSLASGFVTIAPGESQTIPFTVHVPSNATPGSHFGGVFLNTNIQKQTVNGAAVGFKIGSIVSLRIAGAVNEEARLREFSTDKLVYTAANVHFSSKFENLGNVLLRPHGLIEVTDMFGKKVGNITVNDSASAVFPMSNRSFSTSWSSDGFAFGRYQATVSLVYGDDGHRTVSGTTSFWILPLKPILITLGTILLIVVLLYAFVRAYIRSKLRSMGVQDGRDASLYGKKYGTSSSRLMMIVLGIALLCVVILAALFLIFA